MNPRSHIIPLIISVFILAAAGPVAWAAGSSSETHTTHEAKTDQENVAGTVTRLKSSALAVQDAVPRPLTVGSPILVGDALLLGLLTVEAEQNHLVVNPGLQVDRAGPNIEQVSQCLGGEADIKIK